MGIGRFMAEHQERDDIAAWLLTAATIDRIAALSQILDAALPAASSTGSQTGENGGA